MPPVHIALRVAQPPSPGGDPIVAHQEIIEAEGAVLFGKFGRPMGSATASLVNDQARSGKPTFLFIASPAAMKMAVFRGRIEAVSNSLGDDERRLVPSYYGRDRISKVGSWFRLTALQKDDVGTLRKLINARSGKPLMSLLAASRSSMFIVETEPGSRL